MQEEGRIEVCFLSHNLRRRLGEGLFPLAHPQKAEIGEGDYDEQPKSRRRVPTYKVGHCQGWI
uniref:Uncharacterized protein n=1 Tax=Medicago truncatula TaxID=3880 RepID=Q2HS32_MEDTR|nr:hypothetical protein MtrDRAFT_AC157503g17v2 [Medicago truncatula]